MELSQEFALELQSELSMDFLEKFFYKTPSRTAVEFACGNSLWNFYKSLLVKFSEEFSVKFIEAFQMELLKKSSAELLEELKVDFLQGFRLEL